MQHYDNSIEAMRVRLSWQKWAIFFALIAVALIEIQFSGASWNLIYGLLRGPLGFLDSFFANTEQYVGDFTIATIVILIWIFDPRHRKTIVPYLIGLLLVSTVVTVVKNVCGRARPTYGWKMETEERDEIRRYLETSENPILKPERGDYWLWLSKDRPGSEVLGWFTGETKIGERHEDLSIGDYSSFPSGHSASSFLLAAYLSHILPKGRWLWYLLAFGCALSRTRFRRHYPGDIIAGGALGWMTFYVIFSMVWPLRLGERVEIIVTRWLHGGSSPPSSADDS